MHGEICGQSVAQSKQHCAKRFVSVPLFHVQCFRNTCNPFVRFLHRGLNRFKALLTHRRDPFRFFDASFETGSVSSLVSLLDAESRVSNPISASLIFSAPPNWVWRQFPETPRVGLFN